MGLFRKGENFIINKEPNVIYLSDFADNKGKYLSMVSENDGIDFQISPKVQFRVTFIREKNKLKGLQITKLQKKKGWFEPTADSVNLSTFEFSDLISFVELLKTVSPSSFTSKKLKIVDDAFDGLDDDSKKRLAIILKTPEGSRLVKTLVRSNEITSGDLINISYRKEQLEIFRKLLNEPNYIQEYISKENIIDKKEEKVWQYFFRKNEWIFGLGLDYQYLENVESEATIGNSDISGKDAKKIDTLAGYNQFTVLIELKTPSTPLFDSDKNRSGSWKLSSNLQSAVSQILEYKASHVSEWNMSGKFDSDGNPIKLYAYDPKSILLIGRNSQIEGEDKKSNIKRRTFELYRRDSRNIEIMTYDELYERAMHIVNKDLTKDCEDV